MTHRDGQPATILNLGRYSVTLAHRGAQGWSVRIIEHELEWSEDRWAQGLRDLTPPLQSLVAELNLSGQPCAVLYSSPSLWVRLSSITAQRPADALQAAELEARAGSDTTRLQSVAPLPLGDRTVEGEHHFILCSDRAASVEATWNLVNAAGLQTAGLSALEAAVFASMAARCSSRPEPEAMVGELYLGQERSWLLVTGGGRLRFHRQISVGCEQLISALTHPIRTRERGEVQLTRADARRLLTRHGLPLLDEVYDCDRSIDGRDVLPALQPVLQRLLIELRQSLKFSRSEGDYSQIALRLVGPGADIARLSSLLDDNLDSATFTKREVSTVATNAAPDDLSITNIAPLLPPAVTSRNRRRTLRRQLAAGAMIAASVLLADGLLLHNRLTAAQARLASARHLAESHESQARRTDLIRRIDAAITNAESRAAFWHHYQPDLGAVLREVSDSAGPEIAFTSIEIQEANPTEGRGILAGYAHGADPDGTLREFVTRLETSPLLRSVSRGQVSTRMLDGKVVREFRVVVTPARYLHEPPSISTAAVSEGAHDE